MVISIITVGMNHKRYIERLYHTLLVEHRPKTEFECIYVDNCSTDGSIEFLMSHYPEVKILKNEQPLGFGANNNLGVKGAVGKYVAIINPDIEILDDSLDKMVTYAEKHQEFGILAPQLLNPNGSLQYSIRAFVTLKLILNRFLSRGKDESTNPYVSEYLCKDMDTNTVQPVNWAMGAALFLKREFYEEIGGFDEDYFLYMEDEDICLRSWKKGKPVIYNPEIKMVHNHLRASAKLGKKTLMHFKSLYTFFCKHGFNIKSPVSQGKLVAEWLQ